MERLPPEAIFKIVCYLIYEDGSIDSFREKRGGQKPWRESFAAYATISKQWQWQIERLTFGRLFLTRQRLETAARILTRTRLSYVVAIDLEVVLDRYDSEAETRVENATEKQRNNQVFTSTFNRLFSLLKPLYDPAHAACTRTLRISAYSPSDAWRGDPFRYVTARRQRLGFGIPQLLQGRYQQSYLELSGPLELDIDLFSRFNIDSPWTLCLKQRLISPSACCQITGKLRGVEAVEWHLTDNEKKDISLRRRLRHDFSKGLSLLPASLRHFVLHFEHKPPADDSFQPRKILDDASMGVDPLSVALRDLSQQLVTFEIRGGASLTSDVLWPAASPGAVDVTWPRLRVLKIQLSGVTPNGEWLFEGQPDPPSDDDDPPVRPPEDGQEDGLMAEPDAPAYEDLRFNFFRRSCNTALAKSWFVAAGRAATRMPMLQSLEIFSAQAGGPGQDWRQSRHPACSIRYSVTERSLVITCTPNIAVEGELTEVWRAAASVHLGSPEALDIKSITPPPRPISPPEDPS